MNGSLAPGERIGDFEVLGVAGEGGMGVVYRARQISLERPVALKVISPEVASQADFRSRFEHEARLAAAIDHPHVVGIYGAGELDGRAYIAMQWVEGRGLDAELDGGPLDPERAVTVIGQIAGALDIAHTAGLVHRDVKPANILLRTIAGRDHAYLTDFGVAKRTDVAVTGLTKTGHIVGTLSYMAPEQIRGERGDGRSDLYSLGCVLYQCLTGRHPFERASEVAVMYAHVNDPRPRPSEVRGELGARFDPVVERAMAIDPDARFQSGSELAAAANSARLGRAPTGTAATRAIAAGVEPEPTRQAATAAAPPRMAPAPVQHPPAPAPAPPPSERSSAARTAGLALLALLLVAAIAVGAYAAAGGFGDDSPSSGQQSTGGTGPDPNGGGPGPGGDGGRGGGGTGTGGTSVAASQEEVATVLGEYEDAYSNQSLEGLRSIFTTDVMRRGLSADGCTETSGVEQVLQTYEEQFAQGTGTYDLTDLSPDTIAIDGNTATSSNSYAISTGGEGSVDFEVRREGPAWLISSIFASC